MNHSKEAIFRAAKAFLLQQVKALITRSCSGASLAHHMRDTSMTVVIRL